MEPKAPIPAPVGDRNAFPGIPDTGLPAMPESPIPDLAPRNRTPDPTQRHARPEPAEG
ncbi:hypothetical protein [Paracoccus sp. N5]|uniref:hypothetical protein n=1 Tax=Paracoccus sp. N5 TaxID=1101189 RepID=UPI000365FC0A|nr:hypothetical protein [Paracoccus sp. N5]